MRLLKIIQNHSKQIILLLGLVIGIFLIGQMEAKAQHGHMTPVLSKYINMVLAGDISGAKALFEANPEDMGTKMLAGNFKARFLDKSKGLDFSKLKDPKVRLIAETFQTYWIDALMQKNSLDNLNKSLKHSLNHLLLGEGIESDLTDDDDLWENIEAFIQSKGYYALSGKTPPLYELMIWTKNEIKPHDIELTEATYRVDVNYLDDFVSFGWANFATFGMTSTGGWAKKNGLYCLCARNNLNSERFELGFLKHEGRHYADYKLYPELQASDMEYRGKLSEIIHSREETYNRLAQFTKGAQKIANAPHPLANWYIVDGFSKYLRDGEHPMDSEVWKSFSKEELRTTARQLLKDHNNAMAEQGVLTGKGIVAS